MSYQVHITSTAEHDIMQAADYIEFTLKNPDAAENLLTCKLGHSFCVINQKETAERCFPIRKHRGAREKRYSFGYAVFLILALMK